MFRSLPSFVVVAALITIGSVAPVHAQQLMAANAVGTTVLFPVTPVTVAPVVAAAEAPAAADAPVQGPKFDRASFAEAPAKGRPRLPRGQCTTAALPWHSYSRTERRLCPRAWRRQSCVRRAWKPKAAPSPPIRRCLPSTSRPRCEWTGQLTRTTCRWTTSLRQPSPASWRGGRDIGSRECAIHRNSASSVEPARAAKYHGPRGGAGRSAQMRSTRLWLATSCALPSSFWARSRISDCVWSQGS